MSVRGQRCNRLIKGNETPRSRVVMALSLRVLKRHATRIERLQGK